MTRVLRAMALTLGIMVAVAIACIFVSAPALIAVYWGTGAGLAATGIEVFLVLATTIWVFWE